MGDRANIVIQYEKGERIYFYGHWNGEGYASALQLALAKRWRWDDPAYLARIIWDEFCPRPGTETGFGISPYLCDNEHPILVVDVGAKEVRTEAEPDAKTAPWYPVGRRWTFEEYVALPDAQTAVTEAVSGLPETI